MDIVLYFIANPPDIISVIILLGVYLAFEILGEIIAEYVARPVFDKFRPDQRIKKVKVWLDEATGPIIDGENLHVRVNKNGYLTVLDGRNPLLSAAPGNWARWERLN